jgi:hypothetical protein
MVAGWVLEATLVEKLKRVEGVRRSRQTERQSEMILLNPTMRARFKEDWQGRFAAL